ncbi:MAG TPA: quinone-dependent dihydroorotate dehydrogenase [Hyphomicrobiaceae bacterium]|mgnify:CR=1 FL=1|nr:quinone-dependent dihydroorotate dehydrogenase [Hyphomicrobiaceae bacterium]
MLSALFHLAKPVLFSFEAEQAHEMSLKALESGVYPRDLVADSPSLAVEAFGLRFSNPVGIAAGYDKDGRVPDAILGMGCGFAEIGTVTPRPQEGNPRPRVFRLVSDKAVINRLGFNNGGHDAALRRLEARSAKGGIVGVNIGANKDTDDKAADYVAGLRLFNPLASYFTVNISSPNTPGLRDLQAPAALDDLLRRVMAAREELVQGGGPRRPVIVKIAPDIAEADLPAIVERLVARAVDGIAVSNTTLSRAGLTDAERAKEAGGLSGAPLFHRSTVVLARVYQLTEGKIPLIGIGGITSPETAVQKIEAGATLLQLYTGLIYEGPGLVPRIKHGLQAAARRTAGNSIAMLTGVRATEWAGKSLEG